MIDATLCGPLDAQVLPRLLHLDNLQNQAVRTLI